MSMVKVLDNLADNGSSQWIPIFGNSGGNFLLYAEADDWDTGSLTIDVTPDGGTTTFVARIPGGITAITPITANGFIYFNVPEGCEYRLTVSLVAGAGADITAWVGRVDPV